MAAEPAEKTETPPALAVLEIFLDTIEPHPANARTFPTNDSQDQALMELAASIKAVGLLEPILVRPVVENGNVGGLPQRYQIIAGERRWRAMRLVGGATTITSIVRDVGDREALEILVTENLQRKDLSPLEEARGVRALVEQGGWRVADVADRLGRPLHWVAQRARLMDLSPRWLAEMANLRSGISQWPAGHLILIARLEPAVQDELLEQERNYWASGTEAPPYFKELERTVTDLTRELRKAPWKRDDAALFPEAGSCIACHKRSACHPGLFEDEDPHKPEKTDRCLDAICWKEKVGRHLAAREAELREKHKDLLLVNGQDANRAEERKGVLSWWGIETVKKTAPGALPALVVSGRGAGTVRWIAPPRADSTSRGSRPRSADGKAVPATLTQRRASLDRRRRVKAVELVKEAIAGIEPFPQTADAGTFFLAACAAVFGTKHQRNSSQWDGGFRYDDRAGLDRNPQGAWKLLAAIRYDLQECCTELWHEVRLVLLERLAYQGTPTDVKKLWADAEAACEVLGIEAGACLLQAVEAIPEPKSWAGLKADGRSKGARAAKGKGKPKAKSARKAKPEENEAEAEL